MTMLSASVDLPPPTRSALPVLVLIGVTIIWGVTFLVVQRSLQWVGPFGFVGLRFALAGVVALLLCGRDIARVTRTELRMGGLVGLVLFASYGLQTHGLQLVSSSKSAFLTALYVPLVPLIQLLLFRRHPRRAAWLGIGVAFTGLLLLSDPRGMQLNFGVGEWLTVAGAAMISLEISLVGRFAGQCHPRRVAAVQLLTVALLSAVSWLLSGEAAPQAHPMLLLCVVGMGLATALIQIAMNWAQKTVPATRATIIYAMEPVWAGVVGALAGEQMGIMAISGASLIVASVLVSQMGGHSGG